MKVVRLSALHIVRLYPQDIYLVFISVRRWVDPRDTVRLEGLFQWKLPVTPSGIETATFQLVTHCLNQLGHRLRPRTRLVAYIWNLLASSCLSVRPHRTTRLPREGSSRNLNPKTFRNPVDKNSSVIKAWQEQRLLHMNTYFHLWQYLAEFFLEWRMFQTNVVEKDKTHILYSINIFPRKSCRLWDNVENIWYSQTGHGWQYNTALALCVMDI